MKKPPLMAATLPVTMEEAAVSVWRPSEPMTHVTGAAGHVHIDQLAAGGHAGTGGDAAGGMGRRNQRQRHGSGQCQGKQSFHDGCHFLLLIFYL